MKSADEIHRESMKGWDYRLHWWRTRPAHMLWLAWHRRRWLHNCPRCSGEVPAFSVCSTCGRPGPQ